MWGFLYADPSCNFTLTWLQQTKLWSITSEILPAELTWARAFSCWLLSCHWQSKLQVLDSVVPLGPRAVSPSPVPFSFRLMRCGPADFSVREGKPVDNNNLSWELNLTTEVHDGTYSILRKRISYTVTPGVVGFGLLKTTVHVFFISVIVIFIIRTFYYFSSIPSFSVNFYFCILSAAETIQMLKCSALLYTFFNSQFYISWFSAMRCVWAFRFFGQIHFAFLHFQRCFAMSFRCQHSQTFSAGNL